MTRTEAFRRLRGLGTFLFTTGDVAAALRLSAGAANKVASRLAKDGLLVHLARGRWALAEATNPLALPEHMAAPYPAYISLQSALFHYAMISQIPRVIYAVTVARTRRWSTPVGVISLHQVSPDFFFGYEPTGPGGVQMATPEKALLDVLYLSPGRSRLFSRLPEVELPRSFSNRAVREMIARVADPRRRRLVQARWEQLAQAARQHRTFNLQQR
jgi:predicted transcriptional regulator of viral defense system